jgi:hypothetical protein
MVERRLTGMIAAAAVLIVLFIFWDAFRPDPRRAGATKLPGAEPVSAPLAALPPPPARPPAMPATTSQGSTLPEEPVEREPSYFELLARSETRRRIRASGSSTYLAEMLEAHNDSTLRRWENRTATPIRVWLSPTFAANFKPSFLDAVRSAFAEWTSIGVPIRFDFNGDSTSAEVTVRWRIQFEIERTGQTDVTWDENGRIQSAVITIATFDPKGRAMEADDIRVVAIHEVGHLLGLDHSKDSTDIMFPTAKVRGLSGRDVRTVLLLYQLAPGSLR